MRLRYGLFLAFTVACGSGGSSYSTSPPPPPPPGPPPPPTGTVAVSITNYTFSPDTTRISAGQSVRWSNDDAVAHTVTSDMGATLNSGNLSGTGTDGYGNMTAGANYTQSFFSKGNYPYHCSNHPNMKGVVVVS
jgi:plastocyanin